MTALTARCASTQAVANCASVMPRLVISVFNFCATRMDSSRNSVCIMRVSLRAARVPSGAGAPGAYLAVSTPRAMGL